MDKKGIRIILAVFLPFLFLMAAFAQKKVIVGYIKDKQSDEPLPFASAKFKLSGKGVLTDSAGKFVLEVENLHKNDSLQISSVGYKPLTIWAGVFADSAQLTCKLEVMPPANEVIIKTKYNRSLAFWKRIMKHKPENDKTRWDNYSYEIYNKLEVDLENIDTKKLGKNVLLKPLNFVFDYIDSTSETKPFLPAYITETLSDYYYQKNPHKAREIIKAARTNGIDNESIIKQLGGMYQNINVFNNTIPVFNLNFISPFNTNAPSFYNFKLLDTQYLANRRLVHLRITPKNKGDNVFEGDCWVHDTTYALQKITLRPAADANINFLSGLSIIQEFRMINDSVWFIYKDKFVADIAPIGKKRLALKGRKTTTYKNVTVNSDTVEKLVNISKIPDKIELAKGYANGSDSFWQSNRHEELSKSEKSVYKLLDTLERNKKYIEYRNAVQFITGGVKDLGNIRIGPWFYWTSWNPWEGIRLRFDVATNTGFNKHLYLHTYGAYGFTDGQFKGKLDAKYVLGRDPWGYIAATYKNDLDNGQLYYDQLGTDNVFATIFRKDVPYKFQRSEEKKIEYYQETNKNFGLGVSLSSKQFEALQNLPLQSYFPSSNGHPFSSFEGTLKFRYAYAERALENNFTRISLGSDKPIVQLQYTHAFKNILNSSYNYDKLDFSVIDYLSLAPYGNLYYNVFGGKIYGAAPYNFLQVLPGNELMYYNQYAFNLMNRFEFISDAYAGFNIEHSIGSGLFKYIPLTRKLKWRQFWNVKGVVGSLSADNEKLNFVGNYPYKSLDSKMYMEVGTGVDNIFKIFRVDLVWRVLSPNASTQAVNHFGVFGSVRFSF
ncbi:DUF5686 family protein [Parasediminibacterium sp. JCM 36343]|uniref:DUF5686 family protein n=1 Tax=Parasediminibacterium sp. JCM 36343 TaxID=3374279 RepID=UPI00397C46EF